MSTREGAGSGEQVDWLGKAGGLLPGPKLKSIFHYLNWFQLSPASNMDVDLILSRIEASLPLHPLFNRMLTYQQRTIKARQLALRLHLPRFAGRSESPVQATAIGKEREAREIRRKRKGRDIGFKLPSNRQKKTHRLPPLPSAVRKRSMPAASDRLPVAVEREAVSSERNDRERLVRSTDQHPVLKSLQPLVKSVHTLDLKLPFPEPLSHRHSRPFHLPPSIRNRRRLPSLPDSVREKRESSPNESSRADSPYNLSRYFHDAPFHLPKTLHSPVIQLQATHRVPPITAGSNESEETPYDSVLFPVFS